MPKRVSAYMAAKLERDQELTASEETQETNPTQANVSNSANVIPDSATAQPLETELVKVPAVVTPSKDNRPIEPPTSNLVEPLADTKKKVGRPKNAVPKTKLTAYLREGYDDRLKRIRIELLKSTGNFIDGENDLIDESIDFMLFGLDTTANPQHSQFLELYRVFTSLK